MGMVISILMLSALTSGAGIVDEEDLLQQGAGRPVDHAVDSAQKRGPRLVVKDDNHCGSRKACQVDGLTLAPAHRQLHCWSSAEGLIHSLTS